MEMEPMTEDKFGEVLRRIVVAIAAIVAVCVGVFAGMIAVGGNYLIATLLGFIVVCIVGYGAWRMFRIVAWVTKVPSSTKEED